MFCGHVATDAVGLLLFGAGRPGGRGVAGEALAGEGGHPLLRGADVRVVAGGAGEFASGGDEATAAGERLTGEAGQLGAGCGLLVRHGDGQTVALPAHLHNMGTIMLRWLDELNLLRGFGTARGRDDGWCARM